MADAYVIEEVNAIFHPDDSSDDTQKVSAALLTRAVHYVVIRKVVPQSIAIQIIFNS